MNSKQCLICLKNYTAIRQEDPHYVGPSPSLILAAHVRRARQWLSQIFIACFCSLPAITSTVAQSGAPTGDCKIAFRQNAPHRVSVHSIIAHHLFFLQSPFRTLNSSSLSALEKVAISPVTRFL